MTNAIVILSSGTVLIGVAIVFSIGGVLGTICLIAGIGLLAAGAVLLAKAQKAN